MSPVLKLHSAFPNQPTKKVNTCFQELDERRARLAGHILRAPNCRVGRLTQQWLFRSNEVIYNRISHADYNGDPDPFQNKNMLQAARQRVV